MLSKLDDWIVAAHQLISNWVNTRLPHVSPYLISAYSWVMAVVGWIAMEYAAGITVLGVMIGVIVLWLYYGRYEVNLKRHAAWRRGANPGPEGSGDWSIARMIGLALVTIHLGVAVPVSFASAAPNIGFAVFGGVFVVMHWVALNFQACLPPTPIERHERELVPQSF